MCTSDVRSQPQAVTTERPFHQAQRFATNHPGGSFRGRSGQQGPSGALVSINGIRACHKRRYRVTTDSMSKLPVLPNELNRIFMPAEPGQVLTSDIATVSTKGSVSVRDRQGNTSGAYDCLSFRRELASSVGLRPASCHSNAGNAGRIKASPRQINLVMLTQAVHSSVVRAV